MTSCPVCDPPIELEGGRRLEIRHATPDDEEILAELYGRLSAMDRQRRFFHGGPAPESFLHRWVRLEANDGCCLLVEEVIDDGASRTLVAEAGYSMLADGDGELAMAVDPDHRGWLGAWLLDQLLRHAADRGVANLQAIVKTANQGMMALLRHRHGAFCGHPDWDTAQITVASEGRTPSWPPNDDRPHVLVESDRSRWPGEERLRALGASVIVCPGMGHHPDDCPLIGDDPCPLVEGADAVVIDLPAEHPYRQRLLEAEEERHPETPVVVRCRPPVGGGDGLDRRTIIADTVDEVAQGLGLDPLAPPRRRR